MELAVWTSSQSGLVVYILAQLVPCQVDTWCIPMKGICGSRRIYASLMIGIAMVAKARNRGPHHLIYSSEACTREDHGGGVGGGASLLPGAAEGERREEPAGGALSAVALLAPPTESEADDESWSVVSNDPVRELYRGSISVLTVYYQFAGT